MTISSNLSKRKFNRRDFLKMSVMSAAAMVAVPRWGIFSRKPSKISYSILGRVLKEKISVFYSPRYSSPQIGENFFNDVLTIRQSVLGDENEYHQRIWYKLTKGGYIHSSGIQRVTETYNPVIRELHPQGRLATVTVPFTHAYENNKLEQKSSKLFFYGSNHWVVGVIDGDQNTTYYRVKEDRWGKNYLIDASHLHIFTENELNPISKNIAAKDKYIKVDLKTQILKAYEGDTNVLISSIATGLKEPGKDYSTPSGDYKINLKRPSRHLPQRYPINNETLELYGVPWLCNFTNNGIAVHGAYWHNDFGYPVSHGCINAPIPVARWLYLWSHPVVPPLEKTYYSNHGTRIFIQ